MSHLIFENCPFAMLDIAFKRLFPNVKYTARYDVDIKDADGDKAYGLTNFSTDGEIAIYVDADLKIQDAVEIFAHELAHAGVGSEHGHDDIWQDAFDALFDEYNKIGYEMFGTEIQPPTGKDYVDKLETAGG